MIETPNSIQSILSPKLTVSQLRGGSKKRVLEQIAQYVANNNPGLNEDTIYNNLICREKLGSTGIGQGIAIPHCRLEESEQIIGALFVLEEKIAFDAIDNEPVDILFVLIVPAEAHSKHLDLLSQLAEMFNQAELCQRLRECSSDAELYHTLIQRKAS